MRRDERPSHARPPRAAAPTDALRGRPRAGRPRSESRAPTAGAGPARPASDAPRSSRRPPRRPRRGGGPRGRAARANAEGSSVAVTTTSSPARERTRRSPPRNARERRAERPARPPRARRRRRRGHPPRERTGTTCARPSPSSRASRVRPRAACAWRIEPAARTATSKLESGGVPDGARRIAVEQHDYTVVRRVLELLHHELAATRARRPVHPAQRLALLVLAHRVEVEAGSPPQEQAAPVSAATPGVAEEPVECDETRPNDERRGARRRRRRLTDTRPRRSPRTHLASRDRRRRRAGAVAEVDLARRAPTVRRRAELRRARGARPSVVRRDEPLRMREPRSTVDARSAHAVALDRPACGWTRRARPRRAARRAMSRAT